MIFFLLAESSFSADQSEITILAKVNNRIITNIDLIDRYRLVSSISKIKFNSLAEKQAIFSQLLKTMVDEELQIQEAKNLQIELDQDKFDQSLKEIASSQKKTIRQLYSSFQGKSISYASFTRQLQSQVLWSQIVRKEVVPKIKISQSEINELLEFRKIKSDIKKLFISEIYIPFDYKNGHDAIDSKSLIFKIYDELKKSKDFKNIVKQFSHSPTAEFGGEIGWVGEGDVDRRIYQAIKGLEVGEVSKPVLMDGGYYLFKVGDQKTFSTLTDQDLEQIKNIIFNKKLQLYAKSYLMDIRKKAYIKIDQKKLTFIAKDIRQR